MKIIAIEGISGSGKTTLINQLKKRHKFNYVREDRTNPPKNKDSDLFYLNRNLKTIKKNLNQKGTILFDRTFLSCLSIIYAKEKLNIPQKITFKKAIKKVISSKIPKFDFILICLTAPKLAIKRRDKRDGRTHKIWSNHDLMVHANKFLLDFAKQFSKRYMVLKTTNRLTDKELNKLMRELK